MVAPVSSKPSAQSILNAPNWFWTHIQVNDDTIIPRDDLQYMYFEWEGQKKVTKIVTTGGLHITVDVKYLDDVMQECAFYGV